MYEYTLCTQAAYLIIPKQSPLRSSNWFNCSSRLIEGIAFPRQRYILTKHNPVAKETTFKYTKFDRIQWKVFAIFNEDKNSIQF